MQGLTIHVMARAGGLQGCLLGARTASRVKMEMRPRWSQNPLCARRRDTVSSSCSSCLVFVSPLVMHHFAGRKTPRVRGTLEATPGGSSLANPHVAPSRLGDDGAKSVRRQCRRGCFAGDPRGKAKKGLDALTAMVFDSWSLEPGAWR